MNYQNFNQAGGFPIKTQTLAQMQASYQALQVFGELAGNFSILQGCQENNGTIASGIVYLNSEVLELVGGPKQDTVFVTESVQKQEFKNGNNNPVLYTRKLTFGLGANPYNWADFKRPKTTIQLTEQKAEQSIISALVERIVALENRPPNTIPTGLVAIWGKPLADIPAGWQEYIPLRGRMPIGQDPDNTLLSNLGGYGGSATQTLEIKHLPRHRMKITAQLPKIMNDVDRGDRISSFSVDDIVDGYTDYIGEDAPFSVLNPFRIVNYIIKQ